MGKRGNKRRKAARASPAPKPRPLEELSAEELLDLAKAMRIDLRGLTKKANTLPIIRTAIEKAVES